MSITHADLVGLVHEATASVFDTMLALPLERAEPYTNTAASVSINGIVSFIGLAGPWAGTGSISCSTALACRIASQLMMTEYEAVDDEVLDAVAEVTNMIVGNVKTALDDRLGPMGLSIPTVIYGRNFTSRTVGKQEWTIVPFHMEKELFEVQICLAPSREESRPKIAFGSQETLVLRETGELQKCN
jgi:chemotaxis protein CheX